MEEYREEYEKITNPQGQIEAKARTPEGRRNDRIASDSVYTRRGFVRSLREDAGLEHVPLSSHQEQTNVGRQA